MTPFHMNHSKLIVSRLEGRTHKHTKVNFFYLGVYRIPSAAPIRYPSNVGGGGGSVGILTMTWQVCYIVL